MVEIGKMKVGFADLEEFCLGNIDLLESVANVIEDPYEVISTEDYLHRVRLYNEEDRKIMDEGRGKMCEKLRCTEQGESCESIIRKCNHEIDDQEGPVDPDKTTLERSKDETLVEEAERSLRCTLCETVVEKKLKTEY